MQYREFGKTGIRISVLGLGGHEFHANGKVRGFHDNKDLAITPGYIFPEFGQKNRELIVKKAFDKGINFFDLTIDSEKEAMGRILQKLKPSDPFFLQTRPEGMVYEYDHANKKMADYSLLKQEISRILKLIKREHIDIFNFAFNLTALEQDVEYLEKISANIKKTKQEGLIRFATADTFSGQKVYLQQIETGSFDSIFINYNIVESFMDQLIFPYASDKSMAILGRVAFKKGSIFRLAEQAGFSNRNYIARLVLKWILANKKITTMVIGVANTEQLNNNLQILTNLELTEEEKNDIEKIRQTEKYKQAYTRSKNNFCK